MEVNSISELRDSVKAAEAEFERENLRSPKVLYLGQIEFSLALRDHLCFDRLGEEDRFLGMKVIQVFKMDYLAVA